MRFTLLAALGLGLSVVACGNDDNSIDPSTETDSMVQAGAAPTTATAAKAVSELFVQEDPTLNVSDSATQNAQSIQTQVTGKVQTACPGASIQLENQTVTVDFGTSCTIGANVLSGTVSAAVTAPPQQVQVSFTFTSFTLNGLALSGTFTVLTSDGTSFSVSSNLVANGDALVLNAATLTLDANDEGCTLTGSATLTTSASISESLSFNAVHHTFSACYADSGSVSISKSATNRSGKSVPVTETVTFSSTTPTTGQITVQVAGYAATTATLPAHGSCGG